MFKNLLSKIFKTGSVSTESNGRKISSGLKTEISKASNKVHDLVYKSCKRSPLTNSVSSQAINYVIDEHIKGNRSKGMVEGLSRIIPGVNNKELEIIAQNINSKVSTALIQSRAQERGNNWYVWKTCQDRRVRSSHNLMQDVIINWNYPPSPEFLNREDPIGTYHAGEGDDCRCYAESIINIEYLSWPHKVYSEGKILKMTKSQFIKFSNK